MTKSEELLEQLCKDVKRIADCLEKPVLRSADELPESQALERTKEIFPKKNEKAPVILKDGNKFIAEIAMETEKAYLFQQGILQAWVPKKAIESYVDGVVKLMEWFVKKGTLEWKPEKLKDTKKEDEKK